MFGYFFSNNICLFFIYEDVDRDIYKHLIKKKKRQALNEKGPKTRSSIHTKANRTRLIFFFICLRSAQYRNYQSCCANIYKYHFLFKIQLQIIIRYTENLSSRLRKATVRKITIRLLETIFLFFLVSFL